MSEVLVAAAILITLINLLFFLKRRRSPVPPASSSSGSTSTDTNSSLSSSQEPDWALKEGYHLIEGAAKKADTILTQAELEGLKIAESSKLGTAVFESDYKEKLSSALDEANKQYQKYLVELEQGSIKGQENIEALMKQRINQVLFDFEAKLSNFLSQSEQKSLEAINLELKSARTLIDTYRTQQLALIDENIVAVLERTLSLVMRQKLTLKDQLDLVFEALEKAKIEKFFA